MKTKRHYGGTPPPSPPGLAVARGGLHRNRLPERKAPRLSYHNVHERNEPQFVQSFNNDKRDPLGGFCVFEQALFKLRRGFVGCKSVKRQRSNRPASKQANSPNLSMKHKHPLSPFILYHSIPTAPKWKAIFPPPNPNLFSYPHITLPTLSTKALANSSHLPTYKRTVIST